jgi:hypothetical protein
VIATEGGRNVLANLQRKASQADAMFDQLVAHMNQAQSIEAVTYDKRIEMPSWLES